MIILNAGVPRSGTVLVNAMIRALLKKAGVRTVQSNPHGAELAQLIVRLRRNGDDRLRTVLVHTHSWDRDAERLIVGNPNVVAFANYRDPRDACVSLMQLHDQGLEDAIRVITSYFQQFEATAMTTNALVIPYEMLVQAREAFAFQIARRLGLWPTFAQIDEVIEETSLERHRKVMEDVREGRTDSVVERQNRKRILREDRLTLINDRHIQSGATGRWRQEIPKERHDEVTEAFAPILNRYGYAH